MSSSPKSDNETQANPAGDKVHEVRLGKIVGRVWRNNGAAGTWFSVVISRTYVEAGKTKTAASFGRDDLLVVAEVARLCYHYVANHT